MPRAHCLDLRKHVVSAVESGANCRAVAARVAVTLCQIGGRRQPVLEPHRDFIMDQINRTSHLTLHRLRHVLAAQIVSHNTVLEFLRREGLPIKRVLGRS